MASSFLHDRSLHLEWTPAYATLAASQEFHFLLQAIAGLMHLWVGFLKGRYSQLPMPLQWSALQHCFNKPINICQHFINVTSATRLNLRDFFLSIHLWHYYSWPSPWHDSYRCRQNNKFKESHCWCWWSCGQLDSEQSGDIACCHWLSEITNLCSMSFIHSIRIFL